MLDGAGARSAAARFLSLYAIAYGRGLSALERGRWRSLTDAGVAGFLLAQPPEGRLRAGRVTALEINARGRGYEAQATLSFGTRRQLARLSLASVGRRSWRVTSFSPGPIR